MKTGLCGKYCTMSVLLYTDNITCTISWIKLPFDLVQLVVQVSLIQAQCAQESALLALVTPLTLLPGSA